ncbi:MAG: RNA polymerase sigma factor [Saprospiraceae bacterium]|nr:RNA polymerase sigma factor [Saprospiraceae bacterium]
MHKLSDQDIVAGLKVDDRETLRHVYKTLGPKVLGYVLNNSGSREDADELLQNCVMKVWHNIKNDKYDNRGKFEIYFFNIVTYTWIDELRKRKKRPADDIDSVSMYLGEDSFEIMYQNVLKNGQVQSLYKALARLGELCRTVISAFYLDNKPTKEIAEQEGVADSAIRKRLFDCRERLRGLAQEEMNLLNL